MRLYYLTGPNFGISNLALRRLKVSRFNDLNDPFELLGIDLVSLRHRKSFRDQKEQLDKYLGVLCFSETWRNPLLWAHYAEKHTGMALGIDIDESMVERVTYAKGPIKVAVNEKTGRIDLTPKLQDQLMTTKFSDWSYEQEHRVIVPLRERKIESGNYFVEFDEFFALREVVLGSRCELPINKIESIVAALGLDVKVTKARMAFRSFDVVVNQSYQ